MGIYKGGKLTEVSKNESSLYGNAETVGVIYCGGVFDPSSKYTSQFIRTGELETYDGVSRGKYIPLPSDVYGNDPDHIFWQLEQVLVSHTPNTSLFRNSTTQNKTYEVLSALNFKQILVANSSQYTMNVRLIVQMTSGGPIKENTPEVTISSATVNSQHSIDLVTGRRIDTDFTNRLRNFLLSNLETRGLKLKVVADVIGFSDEGEQNFADIRDQFSVTFSYIKDKAIFSPKIKVDGDQFEFVQEKTNTIVEGETSSETQTTESKAILESKNIEEIVVKDNEIIVETTYSTAYGGAITLRPFNRYAQLLRNTSGTNNGEWPVEFSEILYQNRKSLVSFTTTDDQENVFYSLSQVKYVLDPSPNESDSNLYLISAVAQSTGFRFMDDAVYTMVDTRNPQTQIPEGSFTNFNMVTKYEKAKAGRDLFYQVSSNTLFVELERIPTVEEQTSKIIIRSGGRTMSLYSAILDLIVDGDVWNEEYTYDLTVKEYDVHDTLINTQTASVAYNENHRLSFGLHEKTVKAEGQAVISYNPIS